MSRKTWGITVTVLAFLVVIAAAVWYTRRDQATPPEDQRGTELVEMLPAETTPDQTVLAQEQGSPFGETAQERPSEYEYILRNHDDYVTVYRLPEDEIYEYTDVILDVLPEELQEEIRQGKYLRNEEELYNFLENYTS